MCNDVSRCRLITVSAGLNHKKRFTLLYAVLGFGNWDSFLIDIKQKKVKKDLHLAFRLHSHLVFESSILPPVKNIPLFTFSYISPLWVPLFEVILKSS